MTVVDRPTVPPVRGADASRAVSAGAADPIGPTVTAEGVGFSVYAKRAMGQASVVHALKEQASGDVGQYGLASGAEAPYAPIPAS